MQATEVAVMPPKLRAPSSAGTGAAPAVRAQPVAGDVTSKRDPYAPRCRFCDAALQHTFVDLGTSPLCQRHVTPARFDEPGTIASRVEQAMEHVDKGRITLAPDCGFAPGNAADIPVDEAYQKLRNMARAAELLRERHG